MLGLMGEQEKGYRTCLRKLWRVKKMRKAPGIEVGKVRGERVGLRVTKCSELEMENHSKQLLFRCQLVLQKKAELPNSASQQNRITNNRFLKTCL